MAAHSQSQMNTTPTTSTSRISSPSISTPSSPTGGILSAAAGSSSLSGISLSDLSNSNQLQSATGTGAPAGLAQHALGGRGGQDTPSSSSSVTGGTDHGTYTTSRAPSR